VGILQVLARKDAFFFADSLLAITNFDSTTTTCSNRLEDVELIVLSVALSICLESFIVFRENETHWTDVEVFWEFEPHPINIAPK
jgi:hypothetical protein